MQPYQVRFGIGLGKILTDINPELSIGADSPAYWHARKAINYIHQKNDYGNTQIAVYSDNEEKISIINTLIASSEAIKSDWRASQEMVLKELLSMGIYDEHFDQKHLAKRLELSTSALSKRLKSSNIKIYLCARNAALQALKHI